MITMAASPDGRALAFVRRGATAESLDVVIARAPGFAEATTIEIEGRGLVGMDWSPDGRYLAVPRIVPGGGIRIVLVHVASGRTREVAAGDLLCWDVAWSAVPFVE
jgi:Tol biopolymer transport system component